MGIIYYVCCNDCKVKRDLDKMHTVKAVANREKAFDLMTEGDFFRYTLLASFMAEHLNHNCSLVHENSGQTEEQEFEYQIESTQFWRTK